MSLPFIQKNVDRSGRWTRRPEVRTGGKHSALRSEITVRYRLNAELGIWVPRDMKERYKIGDGQIEATAKYSNFQQFQVSVDTSLSK